MNTDYERRILDVASIGVLITRIGEGTILYANEMIARLLGLSDAASLIGTPIPNFYWDLKDRQTVLDIFHAEGAVANYDVRARRADGSMLWVAISIQPFTYEGEAVLLSEIVDISERKKTEDEYKRNANFTSALLDAVPTPIFYKDKEGRYQGCNRAFTEVMGKTADEIRGKTVHQLWPSENAEVYHQKDLELMHSPSHQVYEAVTNDKDGNTRPVIFAKDVFMDGSGNVAGLVGAFLDISEQKRSQEALRASEQRYQTIFNSSPVMFWLKDTKNNVIQINQAAADFENVKVEEMTGRSSYDIYPREQAEAFYQDDLQVIRSGKPKLGIVEKHTSPGTGKVTWLETGKTPIFNDNGEVIGVLAFAVDITEREKVAEEMLRLKNAMEQTGDGIALADLSGTITYANPAWANMHGYAPAEILGKSLSIFHTKEQLEREVLPFNKTAMEVGFNSDEIGHVRKDGVTFPTLMTVAVQKDQNGVPVGLIGTARDITERKQAEQALRENQQILQAVMDNIPQLIFWKDSNLTYLGCNQNFAKAAGVESPANIVGKSDYDLAWKKEEADAFRQDDMEVMSSGQPKYHIIEPQLQADGKQTWADTNKIPMLNAAGEIVGVLGTYEDITERMQAEANLQRRVEVETLLTTISSNFVTASVQNMDEQINQALELLGKFANTDRSYLFMLAENGLTMDNTHEWCAAGIESHINDLKRVPVDTFPWLMERLKKFEVVSIPLVAELPPQAGAEKAEFQAENIQSIIVVPIVYQGKLGGFMGFDAVSRQRNWEADTITVLRTSGETFITTIERVRLQKEVEAAFERRGYQAQVVTEISQEVAAATELDELFERVVNLTKERLGYYHTQLLRYDSSQDAVALIHGYGETGQKMLEGGHKMPMGSGLIGTAAATGETLMRSTLAEDLTWQPNPLLPETKGEIAVPIKWQDNVLGVLDVQSNEAGALTEDDRLLLESLCGQIAVAIHSAELVEIVRQNEARLAEALKTSRLANWEYDVEKDLFTFNDQFYSLFHTTAEKAGGYQLSSGQYAGMFVHPEDAPLVGAEIGKALNATERVYNISLEHRILYADGGIGFITVAVTVERDEDGKIARFYGANQDITERKLAEARLAEALKAARLANWEYNVEKDIFTFNDQFYAIFHTTAEKVGGYQLSSARYAELFVHPDDMEIVGAEIGKALSSTERVYNTSIDHRILYADGSVGYITVQLTVERDENGKITRYYGANQDITERKQAETALRESELRYQQILDAITDMILVKGEKSSIVWANKAFRDYYGMTNEQLRDMIDAPIVEPDYTLQYIKDDAYVFESGEVLAIPEEPVTRYDGVVRPFETFKAPIRDLNGNVVMTVGVSRDITERLKEKQAMAERLEEINRLYQNLSHEGWKAYRATADLPSGFMFDQTGVKPLEDTALAGEHFANVPMKVMGGEVVGNLAVADDPQRPISKDDLQFLEQVSDQIALALEGARLSAQTQSALAQTEKLSEAGLRFTRAADLQELVQIAVETLDIQHINRAVLETFNYNSENEVVGMDVIANWWSGTGREPTAVNMHYTPDALPILSLFITPEPIFISDSFNDKRIDEVSMQVVRMLNVHAVAVLPLFLADRQIGVLLLESEEVHEFNQDEIRVFSAMGPLISTVLENRRQFERARQQAEREGLLNVISQKIQSATSVEAVLQIAARELGHALGAPITIAQLSMKDKK